MTKMDKPSVFSRRAVLKAGGALVVSVGVPLGLDAVLDHQAALAQSAKPPLMPDQLSSYIAINGDGSVSAYFGKMDMGHGLAVAISQIVAEELDVPFKSVKVIMADTDHMCSYTCLLSLGNVGMIRLMPTYNSVGLTKRFNFFNWSSATCVRLLKLRSESPKEMTSVSRMPVTPSRLGMTICCPWLRKFGSTSGLAASVRIARGVASIWLYGPKR